MPLQGPTGTKATVALFSLAGILFAYLAGSTDDLPASIAYMGGALLLWVAAGLTMGLKPKPEAVA